MGKPKLSVAKSVNGAPSGDWKVIDTPVQDSVNLDTQEGTDLEAREEGGEIVDKISQAATYTLTFELFKKDGVPFPFTDNGGVVSGEYAIRVESGIDGHKAPHLQIDRATVKTSTLYSVNDTLRKQFTFSALKPASGDTVKVLDQGATAEVENDITDTTETGGGTGE
ncbi:MAG: hypothetical protein IJV22_06130 [Bacteroidales bacterium]|nr:hypothetical protein [Bacteroidales bacterium]